MAQFEKADAAADEKTVWRACVNGEAVGDWVDSLQAAMSVAVDYVHKQGEKSDTTFMQPNINIEKRSVPANWQGDSDE